MGVLAKLALSAAVASAVTLVSAEQLYLGSEVLRRAEEVRSPSLDYAVDLRIDVTDPSSAWKERTAAYAMVAAGRDHSIVLMREPEQFYPGVLLIAEGYYWMLLPRSDKPFQLAPRHVLAGDVSNGDLARVNLLAYYSAELGADTDFEGRACYQVELTRTRSLGLYSRILASIDKDNFRPLRFQYFGNTGELLKTARPLDYRGGPLGVRSMRIEIEDHTRPEEHTTLSFSDLRRFDMSGLAFTQEGLNVFRDAAAKLRDELGRQATLEEISGRLAAPGP